MNYYTGGLAELVTRPSRLTFSFFENWFRGDGSLGKAMELLGLPYKESGKSVLAMHRERMFVDLDQEEEVYYKKSIFRYVQREDTNQEPILKVKLKSLLDREKVRGTLAILSRQSYWIGNSKKTIETMQNWLTDLKRAEFAQDWQKTDEQMKNFVWPKVIATGYLAEFFYQVLVKEWGRENDGWGWAAKKIAEYDWLYESLADRAKIVSGELSFEDYIEKYGIRGDIDYELDCPRWYEVPAELKSLITNEEVDFKPEKNAVVSKQVKETEIVKAYIQSQILRNEFRRETLRFVDKLRQAIIKEAGSVHLGSLTRADLRGGKKNSSVEIIGEIEVEKKENSLRVRMEGKGRPVSVGEARGKVHHFLSGSEEVTKGIIGIFPNASTEFTRQFSRCVGLIFISGGATSHGAIVAREFGIPALVDAKAINIAEGVNCDIKADIGVWKVLE